MTKKSNINILSNLKLSVQVSLNGLSFCILDVTENNIVLLKEIVFNKEYNPIELEEEIKNYFSSTPELNQEFKQVSILHQNNLISFVPKALFNEDNLSSYLKFNNKIFESDFITHDEILGKDIIGVFVPFVNINNFFFDRFGSFDYHHASISLVRELLQQNTSVSTKLYCHINEQSFELIYIKDGELNFFNHFDYYTPEDFIYYVLFSIEQLGINTEIIDFIFLGKIGLDDEIYSLAYQYIRNVSFGSRETQFLFRDPENKPKYGYDHFTLLNTF